MFRVVKLSQILLIALLFMGCVDSEQPAIHPDNAVSADELHGLWKATWGREQVHYYHIEPAGGEFPENTLRGESITRKKNGSLELQSEVMFLIPGKIEDFSILSAAEVNREVFVDMFENGWRAEAVNNYIIFSYSLEDDTISLFFIDNDLKRQYINSGELRGVVEDDESKITASSEELKRFLKTSSGRNIFSKEALKLKCLDSEN